MLIQTLPADSDCHDCWGPGSETRHQSSPQPPPPRVQGAGIINRKSEITPTLTARIAADQDQRSEIRKHRGPHCQKWWSPRPNIINHKSPQPSLPRGPVTRIRKQKSEITPTVIVNSAHNPPFSVASQSCLFRTHPSGGCHRAKMATA